ncbi:MAG: hypothetical protein NC314_13725 [Roseburia sp.]|nr:hypothetical protein [Roseburia sp.]MCM1243897.1 hypothetical protein [Roseburia sp.]
MNNESRKIQISCKAVIGWSLIAIGFIMLCNSIRLCFSEDIWYDELFTVGMAEHSYGEFIRFTAKDVHPPLYYCIVKMVLDLCKLVIPAIDTVIVIKLISVIPYFLLLLYALTLVRKKFGILTAGVFFFGIMSMPQMSAYTVEMRMYGFALFFVTAAFFHAYGIVSGGGDRGNLRLHYTALTLYGLAAAYTQYFACVAVIMVYVYLFVWSGIGLWGRKDKEAGKALRRLLLCVLVSIAGYLPWFFVLLSQISAVRDNYWILPLTWRSLGGCVKFLMKPAFANETINTVLAAVMFLIYVTMPACLICRILQERKTGKTMGKTQEPDKADKVFYAAAGCLVLCGLVGFGFIASLAIRPIFVYRYMLPAMGCFWLCFAICLGLSGEEGTGRPLQIVSVLALLLFVVVGLRDYRAFMGEEEYKAVLMKETKQALSQIEEETIILYNFDQLQAVTDYYTTQKSYLYNGSAESLVVEIFGEKGSVDDMEQIRKWLSEGRKVCFFGSFNSREDIRKEWKAAGIASKERGSYMLERYWFNIYELSLLTE